MKKRSFLVTYVQALFIKTKKETKTFIVMKYEPIKNASYGLSIF